MPVRFDGPAAAAERDALVRDVWACAARHAEAQRATKTMNTITCEQCGVTYGIGASPWCRDGHATGSTSIEDVTWPGGITFENLGHEPVTLYSRSELKAELKARGLEECVRHVPGDRHTRSWATMDPYTLEQARILAERQAHTPARGADDPGPSADTVAVVREAFAQAGLV